MAAVCRALAEEDVSSGPGPIAAAVGPAVGDIYVSGSVTASGLPSLNAWLSQNGSIFPDVVESLVTSHLDKGDHMSAMITGEWCATRPPLNAEVMLHIRMAASDNSLGMHLLVCKPM